GAHDQSGHRAGPRDQAGRGDRACRAAGQTRALREAALPAAGADGAAGERAECRAARPVVGPGAGREEEIRGEDGIINAWLQAAGSRLRAWNARALIESKAQSPKPGAWSQRA